MSNEKRLIDANAMKHRLEAHIATVIYKGIKDVPTSYDSCNPTEYLKGYERGAIETANLALGQPIVDDVEVVHGRWKYYHKKNIAVCTNCSFERNLDENFGKAVSCPNCGAKMDGDGNGAV